MLKKYMALALTFFFMFSSFGLNAEAATKKKKQTTTSSKSSKRISKSSKKHKNRYGMARSSKSRRYKRSGNGPDIRKLTTESESPYAEYTEAPDNGVNAVETKAGL